MSILKDALGVCEQLNYKSLVGYNTLLMLYKKGGLPPHTNMATLEVFGAYNPNLFKPLMKRKGFTLLKEEYDQTLFKKENKFIIEIIHYRVMGDEWMAFYPCVGKITIPVEYTKEDNTLVGLPTYSNIDGYLTHVYRDNWRNVRI